MILNFFKKHNDHRYPLMRDPMRLPRCYELTDTERQEANRKVDELLKERFEDNQHGYYGA